MAILHTHRCCEWNSMNMAGSVLSANKPVLLLEIRFDGIFKNILSWTWKTFGFHQMSCSLSHRLKNTCLCSSEIHFYNLYALFQCSCIKMAGALNHWQGAVRTRRRDGGEFEEKTNTQLAKHSTSVRFSLEMTISISPCKRKNAFWLFGAFYELDSFDRLTRSRNGWRIAFVTNGIAPSHSYRDSPQLWKIVKYVEVSDDSGKNI